MSNGEQDRNPDDPRAWARTTLEMPRDATPESERRGMLERLEQADFVPPLAWREAITLLGDRPGAATECFDRDRRDALVAEVAEFADGFFQHPVEDRARRWERLVDRAESFPAVVARLKSLRPGLRVELAPLAEAEAGVRRVGEVVLRMFVLPPGERAELRRKWFEEHRNEPGLRATTAALRGTFPDVAALERKFVEQLIEGSRRIDRPKPAWRPRRLDAPPSAAPREEGVGGQWSGVAIALFVFLAIRFVSLVFSTSTGTSSPRFAPSSPRSTPPPVRIPSPPLEDVRRGSVTARLMGIEREHVLSPNGGRIVRLRLPDGKTFDLRYDESVDGPWEGEPGGETLPAVDPTGVQEMRDLLERAKQRLAREEAEGDGVAEPDGRGFVPLPGSKGTPFENTRVDPDVEQRLSEDGRTLILIPRPPDLRKAMGAPRRTLPQRDETPPAEPAPGDAEP